MKPSDPTIRRSEARAHPSEGVCLGGAVVRGLLEMTPVVKRRRAATGRIRDTSLRLAGMASSSTPRCPRRSRFVVEHVVEVTVELKQYDHRYVALPATASRAAGDDVGSARINEGDAALLPDVVLRTAAISSREVDALDGACSR